MPQCFVSNCTNYYGKTRGKEKVMYHIFPTKHELAAKWSILCGYKKDFKAPPYARVCSEHFSPNCYQRDLQHELLGLPLRKKLKAEAVPNRNLPNQNSSNQKSINESQLDKRKVNNVTKATLATSLNNKSKQQSFDDQTANRKVKTQVENVTNGNTTKSKPKIKTGLSKSLIKISINDLCRSKMTTQRRSDPLRETTVNKIERRLTKEVTIEPIKRDKKTVCIEPVQKLTKDISIEKYLPVKEKVDNVIWKETMEDHKSNNTEVSIHSGCSQPDMSNENSKCNDDDEEPLLTTSQYLNKSKRERMPMRSSIRIAKKKSIESLSESFTMKVNSKIGDKEFHKRERFSDKLKFMALLQLRFLRNKNGLGEFYGEPPGIISLPTRKR